MPRFLHAADLHLDSPLQRLESYEGAPVDAIRGATRGALRKLVDLACDQEVDLVVIAGDLYDGDWRDHNTGLFFVSQISRLTRQGIPVVAIRGNHDAANQMTRSLPLPKNPDASEIMLSSRKPETRRFESLGISVHGQSFRTRAETDNLAAAYPKSDFGMFNIGLLHTSLTGAEGHEPYAPCTPQQLADKSYNYWALGHVHTRSERQIEGTAPVVFPGNTQGRHPREPGPKGCVIVDIDSQGQATRSFHSLDVVRWENFHLDATTIDNPDELMDQYGTWLSRQAALKNDQILVTRVRIHGASVLHDTFTFQQAHWENALRSIALDHGAGRVWLESLRVRTTEPIQAESNLDPESPLAILNTVTAELLQNQDACQLLTQALGPLAKKLPDELRPPMEDALSFEDPEILKELIQSARPLLRMRMQTPEKSN